MTKEKRTILFLVLTILFFLVAPGVVLYSQGWRFDPKTKKIVKVGGFYFNVFPKRATVFIDGKKYKTGFFFGSLFVEGFLPGEYKITIQRQGFQPWKKKLKIEEEKTTKIEGIFLIPKKINFEILARGVKKFSPSKEKKNIILISENEGGELKILDLETNLLSHLLKAKDIEKGIKIEDIIFSQGKKVLIKTKRREKTSSQTSGWQIKYSLLDLKTNSLQNLDFLPQDSKDIYLSKDGRKILFISEGNLFLGDLAEKIPTLILKEISTYKIEGGTLYYLDKSGSFLKTDLKGERKEKLTKKPFQIEKEKGQKIYIFPNFIFLKQGNALFLLDKKERIFKKFSDSTKEIKVSPDSKKLVFCKDQEIWVLFLTKIEKQPRKKKGERLFLTRFSERIGDVFWYTPDYLIFNVGKQIKVAEIDERDKVQIWDLKDIKGSKIFFNQETKRLYFQKGENLFMTGRLIK